MNAGDRISHLSASPGRSLDFYAKWATVMLTLTGFSLEQAYQLVAVLKMLLSSIGGFPVRWRSWRAARRTSGAVSSPTVTSARRGAREPLGRRDHHRRAGGQYIPFSREVSIL